VAEENASKVGSLLRYRVQHSVTVSLPPREVHLERNTGPGLGSGRPAQHLLLLGGKVLGDPDLPYDPGLHPSDALFDVAPYLLGDGLDAHPLYVLRMRRLEVIARPHHHV
jgi:hypothetical protein